MAILAAGAGTSAVRFMIAGAARVSVWTLAGRPFRSSCAGLARRSQPRRKRRSPRCARSSTRAATRSPPSKATFRPASPPVVTVAEDEGLTLVVPQDDADAAGLAYDDFAGWIKFRVSSAPEAVGLTAAVARALADAGLSCNVVAGCHHDHLFVPYDRAAQAVAVLEDLARRPREAGMNASSKTTRGPPRSAPA